MVAQQAQAIIATEPPARRHTARVYRRPTWWTVRLLDGARFAAEVTLFHSGCVLNWHTVTVDKAGAVACTCPSGREGFKRTQRGWCDHVEALVRSALRRYLPIRLTAERLQWYPPCHGCRPACRTVSSSTTRSCTRTGTTSSPTPRRPARGVRHR